MFVDLADATLEEEKVLSKGVEEFLDLDLDGFTEKDGEIFGLIDVVLRLRFSLEKIVGILFQHLNLSLSVGFADVQLFDLQFQLFDLLLLLLARIGRRMLIFRRVRHLLQSW